MNRDLAHHYTALSVSCKCAVCEEMGFGTKYTKETRAEYDKRFLSFVENEGKIRELERLVVQYS